MKTKINTYSGKIAVTDDLPAPSGVRWVASRKLALLNSVNRGILTLEDAGSIYGLTVEELVSWQQGLARQGLKGLFATRRR